MGTFPGLSRKEIYEASDKDFEILYQQAIFYLKFTGILQIKEK
jgi:hypothetical protein